MEINYGLPENHRLLWSSRLGRWASPLFELNAVRITLIYLFLGMSALVFSDLYLVGLVSDPFLAQLQALKGTVEVLLTGGLIFALTRTYEWQSYRASSKVESQRDELHLLHRVMRHNLRNDLNVIYGKLDQLVEEQLSPTPPELHQNIVDKLGEIEADIENLRKIREVTNGNLDTVTVNLARAIDSLLKTHPHITAETEVSVSVPEDIAVQCNHMLHEAVEELLTNAIRHNPSSNPKLDINVDPDSGPPGMVAIHVTDNGPGLPHMEIKAIQARRAKAESQVLHSNGLGLWFVDWVVTQSGGKLQVDVSEANGTRITLCVPLADG